MAEFSEYENAIIDIVNLIRFNQYDVFKEKAFNKRKTAASIKIIFETNPYKNALGRCDYINGILYFRIVDWKCIFNKNRFGYKREAKYIDKYCESILDCLVWVVCHEWQHLYKDMQYHKPKFFIEVEKLYLEIRPLIESGRMSIKENYPNLLEKVTLGKVA